MAEGMNFSAALGEATGALSGMVGAIGNVVSASAKFVEAVAPSAVLVLNQAMYDFSAVIGTALTPIVYGAAEAIKMIGGVLLPVMRALQPVVAQLTGTFLQLLEEAMPAFEAMGEIFVMLATMVAELVDALSPIITITTVLYTVFWDLVKGLLSWIGSLFGDTDVMGNFKKVMQQLAGTVLLAIGALAVWVGNLFGIARGGMVMESLLKATAPKKPGDREDPTGLGVAKDAAFKDFGTYGRDISKAALLAGSGAGPKKTDNAWLEEINRDLNKLADGNETFGSLLMQRLDRIIEILGIPKETWDATKEAVAATPWTIYAAGTAFNESIGMGGVQRAVTRWLDERYGG